ncbi:MAG: hypothetical protein Fur0018_24970 [Anaerolineales bacterium]
MMGPGMMGGYGGFGWIGMILNLVFTVVVIIGIVWLVIWAVRRAGNGTPVSFGQSGAAPSPKEILQARYARGEISRDEYLSMLADLQ